MRQKGGAVCCGSRRIIHFTCESAHLPVVTASGAVLVEVTRADAVGSVPAMPKVRKRPDS